MYGATVPEAPLLPRNGQLPVSAELTHRGTCTVREVAQLYIRQRVASLSRPVRELKGFQAVELQPGETRSVTFALTRHDLAFVQAGLDTAAEPGVFDVVIAPSAPTGTAAAIELLQVAGDAAWCTPGLAQHAARSSMPLSPLTVPPPSAPA